MPLSKDHSEYDYLQEKLDELRQRISEKREQASQLFAEILQYLDANLGVEIPEGLQKELQEIKAMLSQQRQASKTSKETAADVAEITTEDILKALNAMLSSIETPLTEEQKAAIHTQKMREELRKVIAARTSILASQLPLQLRHIAQAEDFVSLLNSAELKPLCQQFGGVESVLDQAMTVAESRLSVLDKVANISDKISGDVTVPDQTPVEQQAFSDKQR